MSLIFANYDNDHLSHNTATQRAPEEFLGLSLPGQQCLANATQQNVRSPECTFETG